MANNSAATLDVNSRYYAVAQLLPIGTLIVFVNGVVFLLFAKNKRLRTPTNYFLFGLAVCDFLTGLINIPLTIIVLTRVMAPPAGVVVGFFGVVLQSIKIRQGMLVSKREKQKYTVNRKVHNVRRSTMIFGLMAFLYAICWFPWYVISFLSSLWFPLSEEARRTLSKFAHAFLIVRYLTSIVNPVLYTFFKRDFQETFKTVVLRRNIQQENSRTAYLSGRQRPPCNIDLANGSSFLAWKHGQLTNIEYVSAV